MEKKISKAALPVLFGFFVMGFCGAAVVPPVMGLMADAIGSQVGSIIVLGACALYLVFCAFYTAKLGSKDSE